MIQLNFETKNLHVDYITLTIENVLEEEEFFKFPNRSKKAFNIYALFSVVLDVRLWVIVTY